jgi:YVTN family beta-propeller protein
MSAHDGSALVLLVLHKQAHDLRLYDVASGVEVARVATRRYPHELCVDLPARQVLVSEYGRSGVESAGAGGTTVGVYDLATFTRAGALSTGEFERPHGLALDGRGRAYVTAESQGALLIFDRATGERLQAVQTHQAIPHMTAVSPDGRRAYTANLGSGTITEIDAATGCVRGHIAVLRRPEGMAFSADGARLYVANRESDAIAVVDTAARRLARTIATGKGPVRLVMTPDGDRLAFPLLHADAVQVADVETGSIVATIPVGRRPAGAALSPDGSLLFVSCEVEGCVVLVSLASLRVVGRIRTGEGPDAVACLRASDLGGWT